MMIANRDKIFEILNLIPKYSRPDIVRRICDKNQFFTTGSREEYDDIFKRAVDGNWYGVIFGIAVCSEQDPEYIMDTVAKELLWQATKYM